MVREIFMEDVASGQNQMDRARNLGLGGRYSRREKYQKQGHGHWIL